MESYFATQSETFVKLVPVKGFFTGVVVLSCFDERGDCASDLGTGCLQHRDLCLAIWCQVVLEVSVTQLTRCIYRVGISGLFLDLWCCYAPCARISEATNAGQAPIIINIIQTGT